MKRILSAALACAAVFAFLPQHTAQHAAAMELYGDEIPAAFDLRSKGLVSPVRDQNPYATCWAFGALGSIECSEIARDAQIDLSEWHLAHAAYDGKYGYHTEKENILNAGAQYMQAITLMTNWVGPKRESDFPYWGETPDLSGNTQSLQAKDLLHVTGTHQIMPYDNFGNYRHGNYDVKQAIISGHAVYFDSTLDAFGTPAYDHEKYNYYAPYDIYDRLPEEYQDQPLLGHVMLIVGWDDNYPASAFHFTPARNGAWLVKNSWGEYWGDGGYVWISYDDEHLCNFTFLDTEAAECHDTLYAHDDFGYGGTCSPTANFSNEYLYGANIFTAQEDSVLTDVMLYCTSTVNQYEITVYTDLTNPADPASGKASAVTKPYMEDTGYRTVSLDEPVFVAKDSVFSVCMKITDPSGAGIPCELSYADDYSSSYPTENVLYTEHDSAAMNEREVLHDFHAGESFYSADGKNWKDLFHLNPINRWNDKMIVGNICLKAMSNRKGKVLFSDYHAALPAGSSISLSNPEGADIYYSTNGTKYVKYEKPVPFTKEMTLSAYADIGDKTVYSQHYTQQKAALSSLLMTLGNAHQYLSLEGADAKEAVKSSFDLSTTPEARLIPISTGSIKINGRDAKSGQDFMLDVSGKETEIVVEVTQENLLPTTYRFLLSDSGWQEIPNGIWIADSYMPRGLDTTTVAFEFSDGNGTWKDLITGKTEQFTYEMAERKIYTFQFADRTEKMTAASIYLPENPEGKWDYKRFTLVDESGREYAGKFSRTGTLAENRIYTRDEIASCFRKMYADDERAENLTITAESLSEDMVLVGIHNGDEDIRYYYCDYFGKASYYLNNYEEDPKEFFYTDYYEEQAPAEYSTGDVNGDGKVDATDAQLVLAAYADALAGNAAQFSDAQKTAADIDGNHQIDSADAQHILNYYVQNTVTGIPTTWEMLLSA